VPEEPVAGSAHCTLIPYWTHQLQKNPLTAVPRSARGGGLRGEQRRERVSIAGHATKLYPALNPVAGIDPEAYGDSLPERFGNPNNKDNLARICRESSSNLPKFLISTITKNLKRGGVSNTRLS